MLLSTFLFVFVIFSIAAADSVRAVPLLNPDSPTSHQVPINRYPHVVSISNSVGFECVGSIVSKFHVVTTAGCANVVTPNLKGYLRAGSNSLQEGGSIHEIKQIIVHEAYNESEVINDIALIRVVRPFQLDDTREKIELFEQDEEAKNGSEATVTGWGDTESGETMELREYNVTIGCRGYYPELSEGEMCAGMKEGSYPFVCLDEADPLVVDGRLAGLASWGNNCSVGPYVYTKIAHYRNWIDKHTDLLMDF